MIINLLILIFSFQVFSQDLECDPIISELANSTTIPNCSNEDARSELESKSPDVESVCNCSQKYKKNSEVLGKLIPNSKLDLKKKLQEELLKALTENLINISKLRLLPSTGSSYSKSIKSCKLDSLGSACTDPQLVKGFQEKLSYELGNILSKKPEYNNSGILVRKDVNPSCVVSDGAILQAGSRILEEILSEEIVSKIKSSNFSNSSQIELSLDDLSSELPIKELFRNHPVLSPLIKNPAAFSSFFKSIKSPVTANSVRESIYNNKDTSELSDEAIANSCQKALDAYSNVACKGNINDKKVKFSSLKGMESFLNKQDFKNDDETIDLVDPDSKLVMANNNLLQFCSSISNDKNAIDIAPFYKEIASVIPEAYGETNFANYQYDKYENDFNKLRTNICSEKNPCSTTSYACLLATKARNADKENTAENRLATSSDGPINELFRSLIGSTPINSVSAATQQVLISQGIWPKPDGTYTPQKKVAERERKFYSEQAAAERPSAPSATTQSAQAAAIAQPSAPRRAASNSISEPIVPQSSPNSLPSTTASTVAQASTFDADMDELKRKVAQLKSEGHSPTGQAVRKAAATTKSNSQAAPTTLAASAVSARFSNDDDSESTSAAQDLGNFGTTPDNRDTRDAGELQNQRAYADRQKALSGMAGAKGSSSGRSSAGSTGASGADGAKPEATLAVTVPDEKLRSEITKILNVNELRNLETLAQSRKDFTFKINEAVFQVKFNPSTRLYAVEIASSRNEMSDRLKSDLVDYLNKLNKRTNSLEALNKNFQ